MGTFGLWQFIKNCHYDLPFVDGDCYGDYYHTHYDDGKDHYKFGGEDYYGLIEINWASVWTLGTEDYHCYAGDGSGTYKGLELPHPFYLVVEEWADGDSFPDYPSKVRLATSEEIAEAHRLAYEERKSRRFTAVHESLVNSNRQMCLRGRGKKTSYWSFDSDCWDGRVYKTLKEMAFNNSSLQDPMFLYKKLSESAGCRIEITEIEGHSSRRRKPTKTELEIILERITLEEVLYSPHIKDSIKMLLEDTSEVLKRLKFLK